jgi:hypothetical protein
MAAGAGIGEQDIAALTALHSEQVRRILLRLALSRGAFNGVP